VPTFFKVLFNSFGVVNLTESLVFQMGSINAEFQNPLSPPMIRNNNILVPNIESIEQWFSNILERDCFDHFSLIDLIFFGGVKND